MYNLIHYIHTNSGRVFSAPKSHFVGKGSLIAHRRYCGDSCCELSLKLTLFASWCSSSVVSWMKGQSG